MTDEQKRIVDALRAECDDCSCYKDPFMCNLGPCENLNAANEIESMAEEKDRLQAKIGQLRDAVKTMTDEQKQALAWLKSEFSPDAHAAEMKRRAAKMIDELCKQLEQLRETTKKITAERDAAVRDLKMMHPCRVCKHWEDGTDVEWCQEKCMEMWTQGYPEWDWRGPCGENGGKND